MNAKKSSHIRNWIRLNGYDSLINEACGPILDKKGYRPYLLDETGQPVAMKKKEFVQQREELITKLGQAYARALFETEMSHHSLGVVVLLEGLDASGKSSYCRWLTEDIQAGLDMVEPGLKHRVKLVNTEKPKFYLKTSHYLEHYRKKVDSERYPITVMDRSWYNRAVVEPVFGFCKPEDYTSFFEQIHEFEQAIQEKQWLMKFYLSTNYKEQLRRLLRREVFKPEKLSPVDVAGLQLRSEYETHITAMFEGSADWSLIRTDDKRYGYILLVKTMLAMLTGQKRIKLPNVHFNPNHIHGNKKLLRRNAERLKDLQEEAETIETTDQEEQK